MPYSDKFILNDYLNLKKSRFEVTRTLQENFFLIRTCCDLLVFNFTFTSISVVSWRLI